MAKHPALANQRIDLLFLDTTYAKPTHTHPPQVPLLFYLFYKAKLDMTLSVDRATFSIFEVEYLF